MFIKFSRLKCKPAILAELARHAELYLQQLLGLITEHRIHTYYLALKFTNYHHTQNLSLASASGLKSVGIAVKSTALIKSGLCYLNGIYLA